MKSKAIFTLTVFLLLDSSVASAQNWIGWKQGQESSNPAAPIPQNQNSTNAPQAANAGANHSNQSSKHLVAECEGKAAQAYPLNQIGPGLSQRLKDYTAACIARGNNQVNIPASPARMTQPECDAAVARAYPLNQMGQGLSQKRRDYAAACMARGTPEEKLESHINAECDAHVASAYPLNQIGIGLSRKRQELHAACISRKKQQ